MSHLPYNCKKLDFHLQVLFIVPWIVIFFCITVANKPLFPLTRFLFLEFKEKKTKRGARERDGYLGLFSGKVTVSGFPRHCSVNEEIEIRVSTGGIISSAPYNEGTVLLVEGLGMGPSVESIWYNRRVKSTQGKSQFLPFSPAFPTSQITGDVWRSIGRLLR